jgi:hypothetical protein
MEKGFIEYRIEIIRYRQHLFLGAPQIEVKLSEFKYIGEPGSVVFFRGPYFKGEADTGIYLRLLKEDFNKLTEENWDGTKEDALRIKANLENTVRSFNLKE